MGQRTAARAAGRATARGESEPMGIVIAGPTRGEIVPRVLAYVWGPAPEPVREVVTVIAEPRAA